MLCWLEWLGFAIVQRSPRNSNQVHMPVGNCHDDRPATRGREALWVIKSNLMKWEKNSCLTID